MIPSLQNLCERFTGLFPSPPAPDPAQATPPADPAGAPSGAPPPLVTAPAPVALADYATKGYHLQVTVAPDQVLAAAQPLDDLGFTLDTITGVDWLAQNEMEIVYDFLHYHGNLRVVVRTRVPRTLPQLPTLSGLFAGANWHEREAHDFFGIEFAGHSDLSPFLLPEDATYHPLRKDFSA